MFKKPTKYVQNLSKPKCPECGRIRGHKNDCPFKGLKDAEPHVIIPEGCG